MPHHLSVERPRPIRGYLSIRRRTATGEIDGGAKIIASP
jgi:hypothetical protein